MYQWSRSALLLALALVVSACASGRSGSASKNPNALTEAEIKASSYTDAYSIVQSLRPQWLARRGETSFARSAPVQVYLDDQRYGGLEALRSISKEQVSSMRFLNGIEATDRWGLDHGSGAIQVRTLRNR